MPGKAIIAMMIMAASSFACRDFAVPPGPPARGAEDIDALHSIVAADYPYLSFKRIAWDSLCTVYRSRAERAQGDEVLFVLSDLLAELKDGHTQLMSAGGGPPTFPWRYPRGERDRRLYSPEAVRHYAALSLTGDGHIEYGMMPGNIGYIYIGTWGAGKREWAYDIDAVLETMKGTAGLVLDLRNNTGGSTQVSDVVLRRFLTVPLPGLQVFEHGFRLPDGYIPTRGDWAYTRPVCVLINGTSFSATEVVTEELAQLPNITTVGDTTGGGGGEQRLYTLPDGFRVQLSHKELRRYDNAPIEWNGIVPDVLVMNTKETVEQGRDLQLEAALRRLSP